MRPLDIFEEESSISLGGPVITISSAYTTKAGDKTILVNNSAAITVTIASDSIWVGKRFTFKDKAGTAGTNPINIATEGSETIDGSNTYVLNVNYGSIDMVCDGANLFIV